MSFNATTKNFKDYVNSLPAATENDLAAGNNMPIVSASDVKKMGGENVAKAGYVNKLNAKFSAELSTYENVYSIALPKGVSVSVKITPVKNGFFSVAYAGADGVYNQGGATTLINAGEEHSFNEVANGDKCFVRIRNSNNVKFTLDYSADYSAADAIFDSSRATKSLDDVAKEFSAISFDLYAKGSKEFGTNQNIDCFYPSGLSCTLSVENVDNAAGYFTAGFQDRDNTTIVGFGGALIASGETKTFTATITRDCYYLKLVTTNGKKYKVTLAIDYNALVAAGRDFAEIKKFAKSFDEHNANVTIIDVGDGYAFADIQSAINSCSNASPWNRYEVRVHNDLKFTSLTDLYKVVNVGMTQGMTFEKNTEINPTNHVAAIIGRDYVSVVGAGSRKVIEVESPTSIAGTSLQWVQVAYPIGNFTMKNLHLKLKGGRYAIHQESGGNDGHLDNNATTIYEDLVIEHCGNVGYNSGWTPCYAMASGTAGGLHIIYRDCTFISREYNSPFYFHGNKGVNTEERKITFERCHAIVKDGATLTTWDNSKYYPYFGCLGDRNKTTIDVKGCDFTAFMLSNPTQRGSETEMSEAFLDCGSFAPVLKGSDNKPFLVAQMQLRCLCFTSAENGVEIEVVGGTAYDDIWGGTKEKFVGTNAKGVTYGKMFIADASALWSPKHYTFELAYKLGNCAARPKTLVVSFGGVEKTIFFNKNYMTADGSSYTSVTAPAVSMSTILADINAALGGVATCEKYSPFIYQTFDDCKETTKNSSGSSWVAGTLMVRDFIGATQKWRVANAGEIAEGVVLNRIDDGREGDVFIAGRVLLSARVLGVSVTNSLKGRMFKVASSTSLQQTTNPAEASFIVFADEFLKGLK